MSRTKVAIIGAGIGGLAAACDLARQGCDVTVFERAATPGGKIRQIMTEGVGIDAGPTVLTMRWVFECLFEDAGTALEKHLRLTRADVIARHAWRQGGRLDLFGDLERSKDAIAAFAGASEAQAFETFAARSAAIYRTLKDTFIAATRPSPFELVRRVGITRLGAMWQTAPFHTLWYALGRQFSDPRLRQLFARYSTYCGASPLAAPATLMLIAHVEQEGVWLVEGGISAVARALQALAESHGARFQFGTEISEILVRDGRVAGVRPGRGEPVAADAVIFIGDVSALGHGLLGPEFARSFRPTRPAKRSLSAVTWCLNATTSGFDLDHHNVFFAEDYPREFRTIFKEGGIAAAPTVYICAQDRGHAGKPCDGAPERLLVLINAPANGDRCAYDPSTTDALWQRTSNLVGECGLGIEPSTLPIATTPADFHQLFPATGGALYGPANHGPLASFARPGSTTPIAGLYLAGGSVHPGPGVPMAALSGRLAAARLISDQGAR